MLLPVSLVPSNGQMIPVLFLLQFGRYVSYDTHKLQNILCYVSTCVFFVLLQYYCENFFSSSLSVVCQVATINLMVFTVLVLNTPFIFLVIVH